QRLHVANHSRAVVITRQDGADFLGDVAQGERTRPVKKARMLHGFSLGGDGADGRWRASPPDERASITGNRPRSHHKLAGASSDASVMIEKSATSGFVSEFRDLKDTRTRSPAVCARLQRGALRQLALFCYALERIALALDPV